MDESSPGTTRPRRRDYEKILSTLETRWKRRPADRAKMMQDIVDGLWEAFGDRIISWCGFYIITSDGQPSVLGPHQEQAAISYGVQDICRRAVAERATQVVLEAHNESGHAAGPEIAIPVIDIKGGVLVVMDVHFAQNAECGDEDRRWLERITRILEQPLSDR